MKNKVIQYFCYKCSFRKIFKTKQDVNLRLYKQIAIQKGIPKENNEYKMEFISRTNKFYCPSCGFVNEIKIIDDPQIIEDNRKREEADKIRKEEIIKKIEGNRKNNNE